MVLHTLCRPTICQTTALLARSAATCCWCCYAWSCALLQGAARDATDMCSWPQVTGSILCHAHLQLHIHMDPAYVWEHRIPIMQPHKRLLRMVLCRPAEKLSMHGTRC